MATRPDMAKAGVFVAVPGVEMSPTDDRMVSSISDATSAGVAVGSASTSITSRG